ncbi:hypothetical protein B9Z55_005294 [Caenorhabditis nigoni]|nr:hypothetical protein B9Z55_005294 [Caenorhabditis nigoni]
MDTSLDGVFHWFNHWESREILMQLRDDSFQVSVPLKPGEAGKPIGVDVGGGVGPYYQQNQHVGVDYLNGNVGTNFGVGVPMAGVGVNTGVGVNFPGVNDILGKK